MLLYLKAVSALYIAGYASQVLPEITPPPPSPLPPPLNTKGILQQREGSRAIEKKNSKETVSGFFSI